MKVLHFYKTFFPNTLGGVEKTIDQIAISAAPMGVESEVLCLTPEKNESTSLIHGYPVHYVPQLFQIASTPFSYNIFSKFKYFAKNADIIHYHFPWPLADAVHLLSGLHKPTVVTYHSDIIRQKTLLKLYKPLMNYFLSDVDCIIATSPNYLKSSAVLTAFAHKVKVIPIGTDKASYPLPSAEKLNYWRKKFGDKFFIFIGVMRYYKGLHTLIEAAKGLNVPVLIVGSGDATVHADTPNVHFLGELSEEDKVALLMLSYAMVLPSHLRSEAFGISLLEAAMFGKPMISCEIGTGTTFINIHQETGLGVPPSDPLALRQAMQYLLDHPDEASIMGNNAQKRFDEHFTATAMAKAYVDVYQDLLNK